MALVFLRYTRVFRCAIVSCRCTSRFTLTTVLMYRMGSYTEILGDRLHRQSLSEQSINRGVQLCPVGILSLRVGVSVGHRFPSAHVLLAIVQRGIEVTAGDGLINADIYAQTIRRHPLRLIHGDGNHHLMLGIIRLRPALLPLPIPLRSHGRLRTVSQSPAKEKRPRLRGFSAQVLQNILLWYQEHAASLRGIALLCQRN